MITIIAVGKRHEPWLVDGIARYEQRMIHAWQLQWKLLPASQRSSDAARREESQQILRALSPQAYVVLLDERGTMLDSPALSRSLHQPMAQGKSLVLIIGGAYGVTEAVMERANLVWSLSRLVFPHQLVRLILAEQLYRAQQIAAGHPYHHQ
ncbi:23S rRNA (pseudouridine(1915)-N(3))-methyltransferase RlmH [Candidatus Saccharibacteria bacterium]|jgi:ribosomal RNA large subunit methyltransferase H|nr:23S rRNA (pseudouridine(1915)-N(3))-methyltransferase RlmH [Candidatus Saccharibacteria bacterium]